MALTTLHSTNTASALPERRELIDLIAARYGVVHDDIEGLDRTRLISIFDTFEFLAHHLPVGSLAATSSVVTTGAGPSTSSGQGVRMK
jgi:hypothetical protein